VDFLFFSQNPVKRIPDSHEITLQHGTKTVSDNTFSTLLVFLELSRSMKEVKKYLLSAKVAEASSFSYFVILV